MPAMHKHTPRAGPRVDPRGTGWVRGRPPMSQVRSGRRPPAVCTVTGQTDCTHRPCAGRDTHATWIELASIRLILSAGCPPDTGYRAHVHVQRQTARASAAAAHTNRGPLQARRGGGAAASAVGRLRGARVAPAWGAPRVACTGARLRRVDRRQTRRRAQPRRAPPPPPVPIPSPPHAQPFATQASMRRNPGTAAVLGVAAGVATGIAAGVYGYEQVSKRMPRYRQQKELLQEVGGVGLWAAPAAPGPRAWSGRLQQAGLPRPTRPRRRPPRGPDCDRLRAPANARPAPPAPRPQYEKMMLPPRSEMQPLEDDIVKQARARRGACARCATSARAPRGRGPHLVPLRSAAPTRPSHTRPARGRAPRRWRRACARRGPAPS